MSGLVEAWLALPMCAGLAIGQTATYYRKRNDKLKGRLGDLKKAETLLRTHQEAYSAFIQGDAPTALKEALLTFSVLISTKESAELFMPLALRPPEAVTSNEDAQKIICELEAMRLNRPGQGQVFDQAVLTGLAGTMLRWPLKGIALSDDILRLVERPQQEIADALRASKSRRLPDRTDTLLVPLGAAA